MSHIKLPKVFLLPFLISVSNSLLMAGLSVNEELAREPLIPSEARVRLIGRDWLLNAVSSTELAEIPLDGIYRLFVECLEVVMIFSDRLSLHSTENEGAERDDPEVAFGAMVWGLASAQLDELVEYFPIYIPESNDFHEFLAHRLLSLRRIGLRIRDRLTAVFPSNQDLIELVLELRENEAWRETIEDLSSEGARTEDLQSGVSWVADEARLMGQLFDLDVDDVVRLLLQVVTLPLSFSEILIDLVLLTPEVSRAREYHRIAGEILESVFDRASDVAEFLRNEFDRVGTITPRLSIARFYLGNFVRVCRARARLWTEAREDLEV